MEVGILGSGFGLYGYLPAFVDLGFRVQLPLRYKDSLLGRAELMFTQNSVEFRAEEEIISDVSQIVVAKNPENQLKLIKELDSCLTRLWLEKPLAPSLSQHKETLKLLSLRKTTFSIGYLFPFTPWWQIVEAHLGEESARIIEIDWGVVRPNGWKSEKSQGGDLIAFYGIHLSPLANIKEVLNGRISLTEKRDSIEFSFTSSLGGKLKVRISYQSSYFFRVCFNGSHRHLFEGESPFGVIPKGGLLDPRVPALKQYIVCQSGATNTEKVLAQENFAIYLRSLAKDHC